MDYDDITININFHDKKIFGQLNHDIKKMQKYYEPDNIFGIYYDENEEKNYIFVIPKFEDLCTCADLIDKTIEENGKTYYIRDVRLILFAGKGKYPEFLKSLESKYVLINPKYSHLYDKEFNENYEKFRNAYINGLSKDMIKKSVKRLMRTYLLDKSSVIIFLKKLTDLEKIALERLVETIGDEGIFSQSKIASDIGMSRLGMTNLIQKLEDYEMAEIQRLGRGGTYCKFLDLAILDIRANNAK